MKDFWQVAEFCVVMCIAFVVSKVSGKIDWNWGWVLCPIWVFILGASVLFICSYVLKFGMKVMRSVLQKNMKGGK